MPPPTDYIKGDYYFGKKKIYISNEFYEFPMRMEGQIIEINIFILKSTFQNLFLFRLTG